MIQSGLRLKAERPESISKFNYLSNEQKLIDACPYEDIRSRSRILSDDQKT